MLTEQLRDRLLEIHEPVTGWDQRTHILPKGIRTVTTSSPFWPVDSRRVTDPGGEAWSGWRPRTGGGPDAVAAVKSGVARDYDRSVKIPQDLAISPGQGYAEGKRSGAHPASSDWNF